MMVSDNHRDVGQLDNHSDVIHSNKVAQCENSKGEIVWYTVVGKHGATCSNTYLAFQLLEKMMQ